jgi:DNA-binding NtrC family response regulator
MPRSRPTVLVVDRDSGGARGLAAFLAEHDLDVLWMRDGEGALNAIDDRRVDCLVTELKAPRIDGMAVLRHARARHPLLCAVVLSDEPAVERAVEAMREGAYDFQTRPLNHDRLLAVLQRGIHDQHLAARIEEMEGRLEERFGIERLTGASRAITRVMEQVRHVAPTRSTVLIEGETGTGKALLARVIHHNSTRKLERFVWANCGALAPGAAEAELFGVERDDESPAGGPRPGRFELADGGTLFLDEVGALPMPTQARLLRAIQERAFERVGGRDALRTDVRLIAATDVDLEREAREGRFRQDLFERLSVARIRVPPLRERREDIPALAETFVRELNRQHGRHVRGLTRGALEALMAHDWPGNVRELRVTLEGMIVFAEGRRPLQWSDLPQALASARFRSAPRLAPGMTVAEAERALIAATLEHTGGDKPRAAAMLGIGLRTLYRKIAQYGLA